MRTREIEIHVYQNDIDNGRKNTAANCPIARAAKRAFPGLAVSVGTKTLTVWPVVNKELNLYGRDTVYDLPEEAVDFVNQFDGDRPVEPFIFAVKDPRPMTSEDLILNLNA